MKLITELIEFALQHDMLTEAHKRKLQDDGFYTFYDSLDEYCESFEREYSELVEQEPDSIENELDRTYNDDFYHPVKRHSEKRKSHPVGPKLTVEELNDRVQEEWKKLTEEFPRLEPLWDSWKRGKLERVLADGFTLNDIYALTKVERRDFSEFSGPAPTAFRQLLRQVGNTMGKYSWVIKCQEAAAMVEFNTFRHQIIEELGTLYETDRERFDALSSQNGKLNFPFWEKAVKTDTTSMKVWTILNLSSNPVTPERIEAIQTWKPEQALAMQIDLDYMTELLTKLEQRDWSSFIVITERAIENTILKSVVIPEGVTAIGEDAFYDCSSLTSVVIRKGVVKIGYAAFRGCSSLTSVIIPEGVTKIWNAAFRGCSSLTSVVIPKSVKEIGEAAFLDCAAPGKALLSTDGRILLNVNDDISGNFDIPENVKVIAPHAFCGCCSLTSVTIPESVKEIGAEAFSGCRSLTSVTIPEGVTAIGNSVFYGCSSLTSVAIPESVKEIGRGAFAGCTALKEWSISFTHPYFKRNGFGLLTKDGKTLVACLVSATEYRIPSGVTTIGVDAFSFCSFLTSVTLLEGMTEIGKFAFYSCCSLTSVILPKSVKVIGDGAFWECGSLTSVVIPEGVTTIGDGAFRECGSLTSVVIPEGVTTIGDGAFDGCDSLTSVVIPEGVTAIGDRAFWFCSSLKSVVIPEGVKDIGGDAFGDCPNLTIHAPAGSFAEKYANENNIPFQPLEEDK